MAGWTDGDNDSIFTSGCPPNLNDIVTEKEKVNRFVDILLGQFPDVKPSVKRMLIANVIRFWNEFVGIIRNEEKGRYINISNHPFVQKVRLMCLQMTYYLIIMYEFRYDYVQIHT